MNFKTFFKGSALRRSSAAIVLALMGASCDKSVGPNPLPVARIEVGPDTTITVGESFQMRATLFDANDRVLTGRPIAWAHQSASVATVDASTGMLSAAGAGSSEITASAEGKSGRAIVTVIRRGATLSIQPASGVYGGTATLSATLTAGGQPLAGRTVTFLLVGNSVGTATTDASGVATLAAASLAGVPAGTYSATANPAVLQATFTGDNTNSAVTAGGALTVTKATATMTLSGLAHTYNGAAKSATVTTTPAGLSGVTLTYTLNGVVVAAPTDAGSYQVRAQLLNDNYQATDVTGTLVIARAAQTISFAALPSRTYGEPPFTVSATSSSGLAVTFTASGACTVSGNTVQMTGPGNCSITASQPGNANYDAATSVTQTFTVNQAAPTRNLIRYSEQLTQWFNNSGATVVDNAFTHNGVSLSLLEDDTPYGFESISQGVTFTGDGEKAVSVFMKAGTTTEYTAVRIYDQTELYANRLFARIRWAAGAPTIDMVYSSGTHLKTDTLGNGFYRFHFRTSPIIAANTHSISLQPTSTWPEDMGSTYFGGIQVENASTPTAYEKTTSVSAGPSMAQSGGNQSGASIRTRTRQ